MHKAMQGHLQTATAVPFNQPALLVTRNMGLFYSINPVLCAMGHTVSLKLRDLMPLKVFHRLILLTATFLMLIHRPLLSILINLSNAGFQIPKEGLICRTSVSRMH